MDIPYFWNPNNHNGGKETNKKNEKLTLEPGPRHPKPEKNCAAFFPE